MAHTFKLKEKARFDFEYIVDGQSVVESVYINMQDRDLSRRLINAGSAIEKHIKEYQMKDIDMQSDGIPSDIKTLKDVEKLSAEQIDDIVHIAEAIYDVYDVTEKAIIEEISAALKSDVSNCFKYFKPFDEYEGQYYVQAFFEALTDDMIKYMNEHPTETVTTVEKPYMKNYLKRAKK